MKKYYDVYQMLWIDGLIKRIKLDTFEDYSDAVKLADLIQFEINNCNCEYIFDDIAVYIDEIEL